jgi:hypothetical protein
MIEREHPCSHLGSVASAIVAWLLPGQDVAGLWGGEQEAQQLLLPGTEGYGLHTEKEEFYS